MRTTRCRVLFYRQPRGWRIFPIEVTIASLKSGQPRLLLGAHVCAVWCLFSTLYEYKATNFCRTIFEHISTCDSFVPYLCDASVVPAAMRYGAISPHSTSQTWGVPAKDSRVIRCSVQGKLPRRLFAIVNCWLVPRRRRKMTITRRRRASGGSSFSFGQIRQAYNVYLADWVQMICWLSKYGFPNWWKFYFGSYIVRYIHDICSLEPWKPSKLEALRQMLMPST